MSLRSLSLIRVLAALPLLALCLVAQAFEAVDTLTPSSSGRYPAYPVTFIPLSEFWVQGGVMVDTNVLRLTVPPPTEEVLRLGIGGRKDTFVYGRQMLRLEGRLDGYLFNEFSELDNVSYAGNAEWHWEIGNDLSGVLGVSRRHFQRDLAQIQSATRDLLTQTRYVANGAYLLGPSFRVRAGTDLTQFEDPLLLQQRTRAMASVVGLDYVTALGNTFGVEYRRATGDAPVPLLLDPTGRFAGNRYSEHTVGIAAAYLSPFFRLNGNIGRTKRTYTELPQHDFEGTTWRAALDWLVTTKTALGFETYSAPRSIIDIAASHVLVRGVAFGPGWAPTAKLNFSARVMRERQQYGIDPGVVLTTPARLEFVRLIRLGAYWEYNRQIHWQFAIDHGERDSNFLGRDYRYNAFIANVRYLFW